MSFFSVPPYDKLYTPYDFESLTPTSATALTATKYKPATHAVDGQAQAIVISVASGAASYRIDGAADPTATVGIQLGSGDTHYIRGIVAITRFKVISASGVVNITYLR